MLLTLFLTLFGLAQTLPNGGIAVYRFEMQSNTSAAETDEIRQQVLDLIRKSSFSQAEKLIDQAIAAEPHDLEIHLLRKSLGNELIRNRQRDAGEQQFEKLLQYMFDYPKQSQPLLKHMPQILINLSYVQQNIEPESAKMLEKAMSILRAAVDGNPQNVAWSNGLSTAVNLRGRGLLQQSRLPEARALYINELERLRDRWRTSHENPDSWLRLAYFLKAVSEPEAEDPQHREFAIPLRLERMNLLIVGATTFPDALDLVRERFAARLELASQYESASPPTAVKMLLVDKAAFNEIARQSRFNRELLPTRIQIENSLQQIQRRLTRQQLIGNRPPVIENTDWLTQPPESWTDLPGRPVLLYCFSPSDSESVRELAEIRDDLKNRHSVVNLIALTPDVDQSFTRLSTVKRKSLPDSENQRAQYRQQILEQIVQRNQFKFPFGIAKDAASIAGSLGISEVPFVLLVDQSGICREVLEGRFPLNTMMDVLNRLTADSRQPAPK